MSSRAAAATLAIALATQGAFVALLPRGAIAPVPLPQAPAPAALPVAALGDPVALSRVLMLWLQSQEDQAGGMQPLHEIDYTALRGWLEAILALDPRSPYPLLAASQVYGAVDDPARARLMLDFVAQAFARDPDRRWPWMAQAAMMARHRLHDVPLSARYARELRERTSAAVLPAWAAQLEAWIAEDMGELEGARLLIGGLVSSGAITDPRELRLLETRLRELESQRQR